MTETALSTVTVEHKWVTLCFYGKNHLDNMAKFVNTLTDKFEGLLGGGRVRVDIGAINIEQELFDNIRDKIGAEEFGYIVPQRRLDTSRFLGIPDWVEHYARPFSYFHLDDWKQDRGSCSQSNFPCLDM